MNKVLSALFAVLSIVFSTVGLSACAAETVAKNETETSKVKTVKTDSPQSTVPTERAIFGAGCFWKVQYIMSKVPGVVKTSAGYTGGKIDNPTYEQVCSHTTGHVETVEVLYDPKKTTYHKLLEAFWANHDPTTLNRQGPDQGDQYRSVVFYTSPEQKAEALKYKEELDASHKFKKPIVTAIEPATKFYNAEDYHQDYFIKTGQVCH